MATVLPKAPRWRRDGDQFVIPPYRGILTILFLIGFVATWGTAVVDMVSEAVRSGFTGELAWVRIVGLFSLLFITLVVTVLLAWHLVGREVVEVSGGDIVLAFELFGFRRAKHYTISSVSGLRSVPVPPWGFRTASRVSIGNQAGAVAFDYGARTIRFGGSLEEAEARLLVKELVRQTPSLGRDV